MSLTYLLVWSAHYIHVVDAESGMQTLLYVQGPVQNVSKRIVLLSNAIK